MVIVELSEKIAPAQKWKTESGASDTSTTRHGYLTYFLLLLARHFCSSMPDALREPTIIPQPDIRKEVIPISRITVCLC